jgi:hypothetical protein
MIYQLCDNYAVMVMLHEYVAIVVVNVDISIPSGAT